MRVLIVDDEQDVRESLQSTLLGFDCIFSEAEDGAKALELIPTNKFDVIFLDLMLPDRSGIEILREARELCHTTSKVIILTGFPEPGTEEEASKLGVFRYLRKPLDWDKIRSAFAEAVSESPLPRPAPKEGHKLGLRTGATARRRVPTVREVDTTRASRPRLLVLDDDPLWLDTMEQVLGNEFDLTLTINHQEACKRARKGSFALVVLDMLLGGEVSGLDVLSRMRRATPDLRAIILTKHPDYVSAFESGRRGALDYVSKGELATLPVKVKTLLSERARSMRVFLSYDGRDRAQVESLYEKLMSHGLLPWMDTKSIAVGKKWEPEIRKAIDNSDYFVFCLSHHSLYREGVMRREIKQALERQEGLLDDSVFFITARLEDCEVDEPLSRFQYVDLFKRGGFAKLLEALSRNGNSADRRNS